MSPVTIYLGRFFGVACLLMCLALAARPKTAIATITAMVDDAGLMLVTGVMTLIAGVACVIGHNVWTGGVLPIAVTALGWVTLLKGLALIVVPPGALTRAYSALHYPQRFGLVMGAGAVLSAGLTWLAFTTTPG